MQTKLFLKGYLAWVLKKLIFYNISERFHKKKLYVKIKLTFIEIFTKNIFLQVLLFISFLGLDLLLKNIEN